MSSQDVRYRKWSGKNSYSLEMFFYLFSAASWEVYKAFPKLVSWVLSYPLLMSMAEAFSVTFTLSKIYTMLWVTEIVFGPGVKSSSSVTMNPAALFTIHHKLSSWELIWDIQDKVSILRAGTPLLFYCKVSTNSEAYGPNFFCWSAFSGLWPFHNCLGELKLLT